MDRGWMETIGLLGVDIMFAAALAMLLAEQVRLVLRRVMARRRTLHATAGDAERGVGGYRPDPSRRQRRHRRKHLATASLAPQPLSRPKR